MLHIIYICMIIVVCIAGIWLGYKMEMRKTLWGMSLALFLLSIYTYTCYTDEQILSILVSICVTLLITIPMAILF